MEQFKNFEEITKPDDRHSLIDQVTGTRLTLHSLYSAIEQIELSESVPEEIRSQFNVARNLAIYTWYSYSLDPVVLLKTYVLIEHALNIRDGTRDKPLKDMLKRAVAEGWISDAGFCYVSLNPEDPMKYCRGLADVLPVLRNEAAHGNNDLGQDAAQCLRICADFINQLFSIELYDIGMESSGDGLQVVMANSDSVDEGYTPDVKEGEYYIFVNVESGEAKLVPNKEGSTTSAVSNR